MINGYKINFIETPLQVILPPPFISKNKSESKIIIEVIEDMLSIGAIRRCNHSKGEYISPFFLVPKSEGGYRFVLNLKGLNKFVQAPHFKLDDIRTAIKLTFKNCFMAKIDLRNAYLTIPLHKESYNFFRFLFENQLFEFTALPFGLNIAPYIFTKVMRIVANVLRSRGFLSVFYLDDIICFGSNEQECRNNVIHTLNLLSRLGWIINFDKNVLKPDKICQYLGFVINSKDMRLELPLKKRVSLMQLVKDFKARSKCKIREFSHLVGSLVAACPAIQYSWLYTKLLEKARFRALLFSNGNYDAKMTIPNYLEEDFNWWLINLKKAFQPIRRFKYDTQIYTDASLSGWGAVCQDREIYGFWNNNELGLHINCLELKAILFAVKCFLSGLSNCEVLLRVDNTTAVAYVNRMGGVQFHKLNKIAREIWQFCEARNIWIFASYVKSEENFADKPSRIKNIDTEWELADFAYRDIIDRWGRPDIDLFASRSNDKCHKFCSRGLDPDCYQIDAFTLNWNGLKFYAFPPFALILKTLRKLVEDEACGIVVVPNWPSQVWYPLFMKLIVGKPKYFNPAPNLLLSPCRKISHPLANHLNLIAAKLSWKLM